MAGALLFYYYFVVILPFFCLTSENGKRLFKNLTANYDILTRPVLDDSDTVKVHVGMILQQIIDLDETKGTLSALVWSKLSWNDENLEWNPGDFGKINSITLPVEHIWIPDVSLYNGADGNVNPSIHVPAAVYSDGIINWIPSAVMRISCNMDLYAFPYDTQKCFFKFGSWTYHGLKLELRTDIRGFDLSDYVTNNEWTLIETTVSREDKYFPCCPEPYPSLKFHVTLKRRSAFYTMAITVPLLLLTTLSILGFLLPPAGAEKLIFEGVLLVSYFIFYGFLMEVTPKTGESVPLLLYYCFLSLILLMIVVLFSIFSASMQDRPHRMSKCLRTIFLKILGRFLCLGKPPRKRTTYNKDTPSNSSEPKAAAEIPVLEAIEMVHEEIKKISQQLEQTKVEDIRKKEWTFAAAAVDRLCFILLIIIIIICSVSWFVWFP